MDFFNVIRYLGQDSIFGKTENPLFYLPAFYSDSSELPECHPFIKYYLQMQELENNHKLYFNKNIKRLFNKFKAKDEEESVNNQETA